MDYKIIQTSILGKGIKGLEEEVKKYMAIGYVPQGGICYADASYCQAMVKIKKEE
ncbi:hypothetical protein K5I29_02345 [Flavobacterium agricola]|uniref:DUF1737 domain-containing protein n=1 Tax=Flavobacterium agricola TaxID=2870839 RepID=A0ABY6M244_9FLAO|nr:hypothetical protein [Flavobacterium agricola]UYW01785.1 hypothetical protein K5I29_02345 [Flavobacterium agricola]